MTGVVACVGKPAGGGQDAFEGRPLLPAGLASQLDLLLDAGRPFTLFGPQWDLPIPQPLHMRFWGLPRASGHPDWGAISHALLPLGKGARAWGDTVRVCDPGVRPPRGGRRMTRTMRRCCRPSRG